MRRSSSIFAAALLAAACAHSEPLTAPVSPARPSTSPPDGADGWAAGSPESLLATARAGEQPEDADYELLFDRVETRYDDSSREVVTSHRLVRVLTQKGADGWSKVSAYFTPWHQARPEIRARVIGPDGTVRLLDPASLTTAPVGDASDEVFVDEQVVEGPLPAVVPGSLVEIRKVFRDEAPFFAAGVAKRTDLVRSGPVRELTVTVDVPESLPLRWQVSGVALEPKETRREGRRILTFRRVDLPAAESVPYLLPFGEIRWPFVTWSTGASWAEVARAYSDVVDARIAGADLSVLPGDAPPKGASAAEIAAHLLKRVRRTVRYTGVEFGAAAILPRTPAEVLETRYGDCKDQAALLVALLRAEGLDAHVVLLRVSGREDVDAELPGFGLFDHAIVRVEGETPLWIDPVADYIPAGELPVSGQGRLALVASPGTGALVRTPRAPASANRYLEVRRVYLADWGKARVEEITEATGQVSAGLREGFDRHTDESFEKWAKEYAEDMYLTDAVASASRSDPSDLSVPFHLRVEAEQSIRGYTELTRSSVYLTAGAIHRDLPDSMRPGTEAPSKRDRDLQLRMPFVSEVRYEIHPAPGFAIGDLPEDWSRTIGTATLTRTFEAADDGTVHVLFRLDSGAGRFTPEEVVAMRETLAGFLPRKLAFVRFPHRAAQAIEEGRGREGLAIHRELIEAHPDVAQHRARYAWSLVELGFASEARAEIDAAIALAPEDAELHRRRGHVFQRDDLGRPLRPGYDREASLASFRRAVELDPKSGPALLSLASALEYDARGRRYADRDALAEAIDCYERARALGENWRDDGELVALFVAERYDEAIELAGALPKGEVRDQVWVASLAASQGVEVALRKAKELASGNPSRLLVAAGSHLVRTFRYPAAAALMGRGARGVGDFQLISLAAMLEKTRAAASVELDPSDPASAVRGLVGSYALGVEGQETAEAWLARPLREELQREGMEKMLRQAVRQQLGQADQELAHDSIWIWLRTTFDSAASNLELQLEGNDELGYRAQVRVPMGGQKAMPKWYLVREPEGYRVRAVGVSKDLAEEALNRARRGDVKGARHWLSWAMEDLPAPSTRDPLAGLSAHLLWDGGAVADEALPAVAAALFVETAVVAAMEGIEVEREPAVSVLEQRLKEETDPDRRERLQGALVKGLLWGERHEAVVALLRELFERHPRSTAIAQALGSELVRDGRYEEAEAFLRARIEEGLTGLGGGLVSAMRGPHRLPERIAELERMVAEGKGNAQTRNQLAWILLFADEPDLERAAEHAERANTMSGFREPNVLHTLATIYAHQGRTKDARQLLLRAVEHRSEDGFASPDWYVVGRIAEQYGLNEAARRAYARVEPPKTEGLRAEDPDTSTYELARRRLAGLKAR